MIYGKILSGVSALCLCASSFLFAGDAGKTSAQYLKIALNPRNEAMGGSGAALRQDEIFYNPAAISDIRDSSYRAGYVSWFEDMSKANVFMAMPLTDALKFAANLSYFNISGLTGYDASGNEQGAFNRNSMDVSLALAARRGRTSLGAALKGISEKYHDESSRAFALDAGLITDVTRNITFGFSVVNKGTKIEIDGVGKELTSSIRAGLRVKTSDIMALNCDFEMPNDDDTRQHFGVEWEFNENYFLRAGWQKFGDIGGITAGFGMKVNSSGWEAGVTPMSSAHGRLVIIDYSYQANSEFDNIHRFSIGTGF